LARIGFYTCVMFKLLFITLEMKVCLALPTLLEEKVLKRYVFGTPKMQCINDHKIQDIWVKKCN